MSRGKSFDPYKKQREAIRKQQESELDETDSILDLRPASEWIDPAAEPPAHLFNNLWRQGELAVLIGDHNTGKSILAVQIADEIARGRSSSGSPPYQGGGDAALGGRGGSLSRPQQVLYVDFQRTAAQWNERYSCHTPTLGKFVMPYEFAESFHRAGVDWEEVNHTKFKRDPLHYALHSVYYKIRQSSAKVIIIDDLTLGGIAGLARNALPRTMQTLKFWTTTQKLSILVISNSPPGLGGVAVPHGRGGRSAGSPPYVGVPAGASPSGAALGGVAAFRRRGGSLSRLPKPFQIADSIFSLNHSTFGPDYRYIKSLEQSAFSDQLRDEVLTYRVGSPHVSNGSSPAPEISGEASGALPPTIHHSPFTTHHSERPTVHHSKGLPLFLKYLGPSREFDHHIDYTAETERILRQQRESLTSAREALALPDVIDIDVLNQSKE